MIIDQAGFLYDVILIDSNHDLGPTTLYLMDKVDEILFMINNDPLNLKSTRSVLSILKNLEIDNYKVLLNNSNNPFKDYFSLYDIKKTIQTNIDYTLSSEFFIENIDKIIMAGNIPTLLKDVARVYQKDYATLLTIAADITDKRGENHEEK
jgi:MinD-like ATPase involved in chromosome partitioning or flagellar assembly